MAKKPPVVLKQDKLKRYHELKGIIADKNRVIRELEKEADGVEEYIMAHLKAPHTIEEGKLTAYIGQGTRRPKWKEEFVKALGAEKAKHVELSTPYPEKLIVDFVAELVDVEETTE